MNIIFEDTFYLTATKLIKKSDLTQKAIDKAIKQFKDNHLHPSLEFKHITCKRDKNKYSLRITRYYRILAHKIDDKNISFEYVLNHKDYDRAIKPQNC